MGFVFQLCREHACAERVEIARARLQSRIKKAGPYGPALCNVTDILSSSIALAGYLAGY